METEFSYLIFFVVLMSLLTRIVGNRRANLRFSRGELVSHYGSNITPDPEEEVELARTPPSLIEVMRPEEFDLIIKETERLAGLDLEFRSDLWECPPTEAGLEDLEALGAQMRCAIESIDGSQMWKLEAIAAGRSGGPSREPWDKLLSMIDTVSHEAVSAQETLIRYGPILSDKMVLEAQERIVQEILRHLKGGGKLGLLTLLTHLSWKRLIHQTRVAPGQPRFVEDFRALLVLVRLKILSYELAGRWDRQMAKLSAPSSSEFGDEPGRACAQFSPVIRHCLEWYDNIWSPLERNLKMLGIHWDTFIEEQPPNLAPYGELFRLRDATINALPQVLSARSNAIKWHRLQSELERLTQTLARASNGHTSSPEASRMLEAVSNLDSMAYRQAYTAGILFRARIE
ncbi:MAG: hypothetical protein O6837_10390 [Deltaproteobacteria bacterium]|nr:hypothetical protein [Deltaproteobacteria bacterium]